MTDPFNSPAAGGKFNAKDHNGHLLLITPLAHEREIKTTYGEKDAIRARIVVIDEKSVKDSEEIDDALIFGGVLVGQTKPFVNKGLVLGRLGQKPTDKGNPAWVLADATDAEKDLARAYLASKAPQL